MECDGCIMCCKLLNIPSMNSKQGYYCKECDHNGCKIYNERPDECKTFLCAYAQMEHAGEELRPDNSKVIFEKINDTLILGSFDCEFDDILDLIKDQIEYFGREGISVMIQKFNPYKFKCYMVKGHKREDIIMALENKANDST